MGSYNISFDDLMTYIHAQPSLDSFIGQPEDCVRCPIHNVLAYKYPGVEFKGYVSSFQYKDTEGAWHWCFHNDLKVMEFVVKAVDRTEHKYDSCMYKSDALAILRDMGYE